MAGPFPVSPLSSLHISRFGVIPKNNQPGKWSLILDLSSPEGQSVDDGIPKPPFTVQYVSVDSFIDGIMSLGQGTLMAKFDMASAYRNVAIHLDDRPLLGMKWHGQYFVDLVLPFGRRSAPFISTAIADLVEWILVHNYVTFLRHYLDDFLTLGPPASPVCHNNLQTCVRLCKKLGLPLHPDKLEGPATRLTILGIELDSEKLQARLPTDKRDRIVSLLDEWSAKRFCKRRELESLIGHLHHACKVAPQGRTILRRMINLLCAFRRDGHPIRLNQEFRQDLTWWRELFQTWDGLSFFCMPTWAPLLDFQVSSDLHVLADNLNHSSIKVYLSAVRSLHIDHGLPHPLVNCLPLQRLLRGIKWVHGPASPRCLPITVDHLKVIQHTLDLSTRCHVMLWAECCLAFFGFSCAGEFKVNSAFDPNTHMTVSDLQADSLVNPSCFKVCIKCSKTDPFRVGCDIYFGRGSGSVCPKTALGSYLSLRGSAPGPLFMFSDGHPLTRQQLSSSL